MVLVVLVVLVVTVGEEHQHVRRNLIPEAEPALWNFCLFVV